MCRFFRSTPLVIITYDQESNLQTWPADCTVGFIVRGLLSTIAGKHSCLPAEYNQ